jgi:hypothetical protein
MSTPKANTDPSIHSFRLLTFPAWLWRRMLPHHDIMIQLRIYATAMTVVCFVSHRKFVRGGRYDIALTRYAPIPYSTVRFHTRYSTGVRGYGGTKVHNTSTATFAARRRPVPKSTRSETCLFRPSRCLRPLLLRTYAIEVEQSQIRVEKDVVAFRRFDERQGLFGVV